MGRFRRWMEEYEANLGQSDTAASDEVKRTNMQPQVGTERVAQKANDLDTIQAIDAQLKHFTASIRSALEGDSDATKFFKNLMKDMEQKWMQYKEKNQGPEDEDYGLGSTGGDRKYLAQMQQHPNMVPPEDEAPNGPGTFGAM